MILLDRLLVEKFLNSNQASCNLNFNTLSDSFTIFNFLSKFCKFFTLVFLHDFFYFFLTFFYNLLQLNQSRVRFKLRFLKNTLSKTVVMTNLNRIVFIVRLQPVGVIFKLSFRGKFFLCEFFVDIIEPAQELLKIVVFSEDDV